MLQPTFLWVLREPRVRFVDTQRSSTAKAGGRAERLRTTEDAEEHSGSDNVT